MPSFKTIFLRSEGKDTIGGATNPEKIRLDNNGLYISPGALPGAASNVLKMRADSTVQIDQVRNADIVDNAITNTHIKDNSIVNSNFADISIDSTHIQNSTLTINKFDPALTWPTGQVYLTNNVCTSTTAIVSVSNGTATCASLPSGGGSLPTCGAGQSPVFTGGSWQCVVFQISAGVNDPYWTGMRTGNIRNSNGANVGIDTMSPSSTLSVSGTTKVLTYAEEMVYCYANDSWIALSVYDEEDCAGCPAGYSYVG